MTACEEGNTRIGYTITKKTGNSVERSRMKRRLRSAISKALGEIHEKAEIEKKEHLEICGDMVIVARRSSISEPHALLVSKLTKGIDRLLAKGNKAV